MSFLFFGLTIVSILILLRRKFDFLSMGLIGYLIYFINLLTGEAWIPMGKSSFYYYENISNELYVISLIQFTGILIFIIISDKYDITLKLKNKLPKISLRSNYNNNRLIFQIIIFFSVIFTLINLVSLGNSLFVLNKSEINSEMNITYGLSLWSAIITWTYAIDSDNKRLKVYSFMLIIVNVFIGSRSYLAITIVIFLVLKWQQYRRNSNNNFKPNLKYFFFGFLGLAFLFIYKTIFNEIRMMDLEAVFQKLSLSETYIEAFQLQEPGIVLSIYNYIIENDVNLSFSDTVARLFSLIPFADNIIPTSVDIRFSAIAKNNIFNSTYGLANSFWGEIYAMLGHFGVAIFTWVWLWLLQKGNRLLSSSNSVKYFVIPWIAYISFYIHRLDYVQVTGALKALFFVYSVYLGLMLVIEEVKSNRF